MKKYLISSLAIFFSFLNYAQPGTVDQTFNIADHGYDSGQGASNIYTCALQSDGKILIGGVFTTYNGVDTNYLARLNTDGSIDNTFNIGLGSNGNISKIFIQPDGKILIGGIFSSFNGTLRNNIARLNSDGSIDGNFNPGAIANAPIIPVAIQNDGKIIVTCNVASFNGTIRRLLARLNYDGTLDASFTCNFNSTGTFNEISSVSIQNDGKYILAGQFISSNGSNYFGVTRLNSDGTNDPAFTTGLIQSTSGNCIINKTSIQTDGKIIVVGEFSSYNGVATNNIARLNTDGTVDSTFNAGNGADANILSSSILSNGKIILCGNFLNYNGNPAINYVQLNSDGSFDNSYNLIITASISGTFNSTATQTNGKIIVLGTFFTNQTKVNGIGRFNTDGTLDTSFNPITGVDGSIYCTAVQNDGKIILGGFYGICNNFKKYNLSRLNQDGTLDPTFSIGTGLYINGKVIAVAIQSDGKIIIGGQFTNGKKLARINSNGTFDPSFVTGIQPGTGVVYSLAIQPDGKIIAGGLFYINGSSMNVARFNIDGSLDNTFNPSTIGLTNTISLQNDGKIIVGGDYGLYRLNVNGIVDNTFNPLTFSLTGQVYSSLIQNDGKIIVSGGFYINNDVPISILRLNTDGTIDNSFLYSEIGGNIYSVSIQSNGKLIIGGDLNTIDGNIYTLIRLNTDGSIDNTFFKATASLGSIRSTTFDTNGKIIVGGFFNALNGIGKNRIARINGGELLANTSFEKNDIKIFPNPTTGSMSIYFKEITNTKTIVFYDLLGKEISKFTLSNLENTIDLSKQQKGIYLYKIFTEKGNIDTGKIVLE